MTTKQMRLEVPEALHAELRVEAARRGVSLAVCLVQLAEERMEVARAVPLREASPQPRVASPVEPQPRPVRDFSKTTQVKGRK